MQAGGLTSGLARHAVGGCASRHSRGAICAVCSCVGCGSCTNDEGHWAIEPLIRTTRLCLPQWTYPPSNA